MALGAVVLLSASICSATTLVFPPGLIPLWSGWKLISDAGTTYPSSGPFLTNTGCSVAYYNESHPLYIAAQRASDNTIWINSTLTDPNNQVWEGWHKVPGTAITGVTPGLDYYYDGSNLFLDVVATGIHGGFDMTVYINSMNVKTHVWTGWTPIPGSLLTNLGVSAYGRRLYARGSFGNGIVAGGVYENTFYNSWSGWKLIGGGMTAKCEPCAFVSDSDILVYASRTSDGQVCWNNNNSFWYTGLYPAVTDSKVAGPLPEAGATNDPYYMAFLKGMTNHQVYGLRNNELQLIPGNKLTDSGLESRTILRSSQSTNVTKTDHYRHFLFVKDMADHRLYFNYFDTTVTSPVIIY
jgi:hypothetical protein